ncbi:MAG: DUF1080 domain-containing protein [Planctomycetaceae bacterium]
MKHTLAWLLLLLVGLAQGAIAEEAEQGFTPIFDGKTLEGWTGAEANYIVKDGEIQSLPKKGGNLYTTKDYADFILRFEFLLTPGANNGIGIRVPNGKHASTDGMEIQILDDSAKKHQKVKPYQRHGSIYGFFPAKTGSLKPVGEWNSQEIRCIGRQVTVIVNGETIVDANLDELAEKGPADEFKRPGINSKTGRLCFCGHGAEVHFRNLRIQEITDNTEGASPEAIP